MTTSTSTFTIPHGTTVPCQQTPEVYFHPDLDIDTGSNDWHAATAEEKATRITAQEAAERRAVNLCLTCPLLTPCQQWAHTTNASIFGVVGGLVPRERTQRNEPIYLLDHERAHNGRVRIDVVERLLNLGKTHTAIAEELRCSPRTITRISRRIQKGHTMTNTTEASTPLAQHIPTTRTAHKRATRALDINKLSPETQKIYEYLSHGNWADREELLTELLTVVTSEQAHSFAPKNRTYTTQEEQFTAGARRFLLNRLDIAKRRGRMETRKLPSGEVLIRLTESAALAWGHAIAS